MAEPRLEATAPHLGKSMIETSELQSRELFRLEEIFVSHREVRPQAFKFENRRRFERSKEIIKISQVDTHAMHAGVHLDMNTEYIVMMSCCLGSCGNAGQR